MAKGKISPKQKAFVEAYLKHWVGVRAAREAKYSRPEKAAYLLLENPAIQAEIRRRIEESAMKSDEVLSRVAEQARLNAAMFFKFAWVNVVDKFGDPVLDENGELIKEYKMIGVDWEVFEELGHLVKKLSYNRAGKPIIEFHDAQKALEMMGKYIHIEEPAAKSDEITVFSLPAEVIAPKFLDAYRDIRNRRHTEYLFYGGRGSTKSSFISLIIPYLLINNPQMHALATREVANTLRDSVYAQIKWGIGVLGLTDKFKCITSPLEIEYIPTGQKIYFRGADDPLKIKSITPEFGYIGILWCEELDQFRGQEQIRSIEQSAIRGGDLAYIFKSFNPPQSKNNWANKYIQIPKATQYQHHSNYLDVPKEWLGKIFLEEAEHLKSINPKAYEHEYMGIANSAGGLVFENVEIKKIAEEEIAQFDRVLHGLDWGYYPDPAQYVKCHYDAARMTLYIFGELRRWKSGNKDLYNSLVEYGLTPEDLIICDSAEPKSIADFREYGASARGAEKGPESVNYSMKWLQSLKAIVIDQERAPYSADEFLEYEFEKTKDGEIINQYPDLNNHAIDAVRYATSFVWRRRGQ